MKPVIIAGIAMLVIGAAVLGYSHFSYTTTEEVLKVGPITATADKTHTVSLPPIIGWLLVAGGIGAIAFGALKK
jgi:hypothetical protein